LNNREQYVLQTETSYPYLQEYIQKFEEPETETAARDEELNLEKAFKELNKKVNKAIQSIESDTTIDEESKADEIKNKIIQIRDKLLRLKLILVELDNEDDAYIEYAQ